VVVVDEENGCAVHGKGRLAVDPPWSRGLWIESPVRPESSGLGRSPVTRCT